MPNRSDSPDARRQQLSSLMDGDLSAGDAAGACQLWHQDAQARSDWHTYHLIGDVLRSEDLALAPRHDAAFSAASSALTLPSSPRSGTRASRISPAGTTASPVSVARATRARWPTTGCRFVAMSG